MSRRDNEPVRPLIKLPPARHPLELPFIATALSIALILALWVLALRWTEYLAFVAAAGRV